MTTEILGGFRRDDSRGEDVSHPDYRVLVMRRALRASRNPGAREMYEAQRAVDADLRRTGAKIKIPGARPGRRTV